MGDAPPWHPLPSLVGAPLAVALLVQEAHRRGAWVERSAYRGKLARPPYRCWRLAVYYAPADLRVAFEAFGLHESGGPRAKPPFADGSTGWVLPFGNQTPPWDEGDYCEPTLLFGPWPPYEDHTIVGTTNGG